MLPDDRLPTEGASLLTHPLAESWQRSRSYGLARADQHISFIKAGLLEERRSRNDWVPQRVQPLIEQLGAQITRQPAIVVIADADGLVLETRGNTDFLHKASRFALAPGNPWGSGAGHQRHRHRAGAGRVLRSARRSALPQPKCRIELHRRADLPAGWPHCRDIGSFRPAQRPYRDAQRLIMQAVRHIEHRWVRSAIADRHWTLRLHADAGSLGSAQELLLVFHDEVLVAANRLAMLEFQLYRPHSARLSSPSCSPICCDSLPAHRTRRWPAINGIIIPCSRRRSAASAPCVRFRRRRKGMTNSIRRRCAFSMPVFPVRDRRNRLRQGALQPTPVSREPLAQRQLRGDQLRGAA